ncbi:MAG: sensor histidine kinase [Alphaproteobacteria bacterium]|nr:sensor histidine kinase [Alphaproteobacteria bacterium]
MLTPVHLPTLLSRLLRHVLMPLMWAGVLGAVVVALVARHFTSQAYDRSLLDDALMVAGHVHDRHGELDFRLSPAEMKAVLFDQSESLFFAIYDGQGQFLAGHAGLQGVPTKVGISHVFGETLHQGQRLRTVTLHRDWPRDFNVVMGQTTHSRERILQQVLVFSLFPQLGLLLFLALWLRRNIEVELNPLAELEQDLLQRDAGDLSPVRVPKSSSDMQRLGEVVNSLFGRIATGLQAQREFSGNVAHELRTPLAGIRAQAEYGLSSAQPQVWREQLQGILGSQERASHLVDQLLALALASEAKQSLALEPICLNDLVTQALLRWMQQADQRGVDLGAQGTDHACWVWGHRALLEGLIDNLIDNALRHGRPADGRAPQVTVLWYEMDDHGGKRSVQLKVQDNGSGVPPSQRQALQDRWQRGNELTFDTGGHGLGLSIVSSYARHLQARLALEDGPDGGLAVTVILTEAPAPTPASESMA